MKRPMLFNQWRYLSQVDLDTLNVGAGTIDVLPDNKEGTKPIRHKLPPATVDLIKYAYERGLQHLPLY